MVVTLNYIYLEKQVNEALEELNKIETEEQEEPEP